MNIFLVGFMGSGKSTLGKKMAQHLNFNFIDVDKELESTQQKTISKIFETEGENSFRTLEKKWLLEYSGTNAVIATGGGMPCFNDTLVELKKNGILVYISLPPEVLADRLLQSKTKRPLLEKYNSNRAALLQYIDATLHARLPYYEQSDYTLSGLNLTSTKIKQFAEHILKSTPVKRENKN